MIELLKEIGITYEGQSMSDGCYIIELTEEEWGKCLSKLERSDLVEEDEDSSLVSYETSSQQFINDKYVITLLGDLDQEKYRLTVKEI